MSCDCENNTLVKRYTISGTDIYEDNTQLPGNVVEIELDAEDERCVKVEFSNTSPMQTMPASSHLCDKHPTSGSDNVVWGLFHASSHSLCRMTWSVYSGAILLEIEIKIKRG